MFDELRDCHAQWGTTDFAFYDDALLIDSPRYFEPFMQRVIDAGLPVRFHMPNGAHYWLVSDRLARLMRAGGVRTVRLSLESVDPAQLAAWGRGGSEEAFRRAVAALREAGFSRREIGVYVMAGIPGQDPALVERTMGVAWDAGALPRLNEFSPIPGSGEWARAVELSGGEVEREPLWQNNSLYWIRGDGFPVEAMRDLKAMARKMGSDAAEMETGG